MSVKSLPFSDVSRYVNLRALELKVSPRGKSLDAELYGLGRTLRHLQPPGGPESGVFDAFRLPPDLSTPKRKTNNYLKSSVFLPPKTLPPRPLTPVKDTTHYKLFVMSPPKCKSRRNNTTNSSVFDTTPKPMPKLKKFLKKNPITGEPFELEKKIKAFTIRNPITFEGIVERYMRSRYKEPPGGRSSVVLEYSEY